MLFACDEYTFFDTYEMRKMPELPKMSSRRGLYKIFSVPTTAWTLPLRARPFFGTRLNLPLLAGLDWWFGD